MTGRAKWDAWKTVGTTYSQKEDAEIRYIEIAKTLGWTEDSQVVHDSKSERPAEENMWDEGATRSDSGGAGGLGVAVSAMARPAEVKEETVHGAAISNDTSGLSILLENHAEIDLNSLDEFVGSPLSILIICNIVCSYRVTHPSISQLIGDIFLLFESWWTEVLTLRSR